MRLLVLLPPALLGALLTRAGLAGGRRLCSGCCLAGLLSSVLRRQEGPAPGDSAPEHKHAAELQEVAKIKALMLLMYILSCNQM